MTILNKKEPVFLFFGDMLLFALALFLSLIIRGGTDGHLVATYLEHLVPFSFVFIVWELVFFIAGLYDKYKTILKDKIPALIFNAQLANTFVAIAFFYLIPYFGITPKTLLFIDLLVSFILVYLWRIASHRIFGVKQKTPAIIVGSGADMRELEREVNANPRSELSFVSSVDLDRASGIDFAGEIVRRIYAERISIMVIDLRDARIEPILPHLYNLIFSGVRFIDMYKVYEDLFEREPLSLVRYNWFLENLSFSPKFTYDLAKRAADIVVSSLIGLVSLLCYPFVILAIKLDDGGPVFIRQERIGQNGKTIAVYKFRSMARNETNLAKGAANMLTRVGPFLRKTRIDELPQVWSILKGDLSLIGPRPELPSGVTLYDKEIPYYSIRHLIKPGLSGWAQIWQENHPHHGLKVEETKEKLAYDLYYIKNRSIMLDITIALKTIKTLLSRTGI